MPSSLTVVLLFFLCILSVPMRVDQHPRGEEVRKLGELRPRTARQVQRVKDLCEQG